MATTSATLLPCKSATSFAASAAALPAAVAAADSKRALTAAAAAIRWSLSLAVAVAEAALAVVSPVAASASDSASLDIADLCEQGHSKPLFPKKTSSSSRKPAFSSPRMTPGQAFWVSQISQ